MSTVKEWSVRKKKRDARQTVTLNEAKTLIQSMAHDQSFLLLSAPGVGKSAIVEQAAKDSQLPCRSLLGTQIAPEDVSGIPRIMGERSVFCPPRILLPEKPEPFCLFLDELPACTPDIQQVFYSLLLERRLGEHPLPPGTWVVAAGNRAEDRAMVRNLSSALINRVTILHIRVDLQEWLHWAEANDIREDIISFLTFVPEGLMRPIPDEPVPFSTPRAWASLSRSLDLCEQANILNASTRRALAFGRVSPQDAAVYCAMAEEAIQGLRPINDYLHEPKLLPKTDTAAWFVLSRVRHMVKYREMAELEPEKVNHFLGVLPEEHRCTLLVDLVSEWAELGAESAMLDTLKEITGL